MQLPTKPRQILPIVAAVAIIALTARAVPRMLAQLNFANVVEKLHALRTFDLALGAVLVIVLYSALAIYEAIIARTLAGPVSRRRAMLGALLAAPIGHVVGWGAVSGGAIRYRLYRAVLMRPIDIGKFVLLAAMPYPLGLGLLLGVALVIQSAAAAPILHVSAELARGTGLALLALHAGYLTLVASHRGPLRIGRLVLTLPPPPLTAIQYLVGIIEVSAGASIFYILLPAAAAPPFLVFLGVYVLSILAGLASGVPAGLGVFDVALVSLLPVADKDQLTAVVIAYRCLLEGAPFLIAVTTFLVHEAWWRLPRQRARHAALKRAHDLERERELGD